MTSGPQKSAATTWNEAPWTGWIETTGDALLILEAARRGLIPRVTRRLVDSERKMISSGSVFVFDEDESGIKRWTDGFFWSPSRILGNFLLYRETDKRGPGHKGARSQDSVDDAPETSQPESHSLSRPKTESNSNGLGLDKLRERSLMGSLTNSYKFKSDGLMKKVRFRSRLFISIFQLLSTDFFPDHRWCGTTSDILLSHRRCGEWSPPFSFFPSGTSFVGYQPRVSR